MKPSELRALSAKGAFDQPTAGFCDGYVQANLVALPKEYAADFEQFCRVNPKPCPLLEVVGPAETRSKKLAPGADLINTIPRYLIWNSGKCTDEVKEISAYYRDDLVFFLLGCSFSFEEALINAGISLRHITEKKNVSMFRTNLPLQTSGVFKGEMVVSMRPIHHLKVAQACLITGKYPDVHGEPVHIGYPEMIGIHHLSHPDYGDSVQVNQDEIPVFWACGVTPQNVLLNAKPSFAITHAPGFMFVGDLKNDAYAKS